MSTYELILKRRTIRKFRQEKLERSLLEKLVNAARVAPSISNLQPLKYVIVDDGERVGKIFEQVRWAGYIAPHGTPAENERPVAFIILLADTEIRKTGYETDIGAAGQSMLLAAAEEGIGGCWMGAIDRNGIRCIRGIPERYIIDTAIALGYPAESPVAEEEKGSIKYYKDEQGVLHVPKRSLENVILKL
jgi:nitroreductase